MIRGRRAHVIATKPPKDRGQWLGSRWASRVGQVSRAGWETAFCPPALFTPLPSRAPLAPRAPLTLTVTMQACRDLRELRGERVVRRFIVPETLDRDEFKLTVARESLTRATDSPDPPCACPTPYYSPHSPDSPKVSRASASTGSSSGSTVRRSSRRRSCSIRAMIGGV